MIPRSQVIEKSLSCFARGIAALIPVVGMFIAPLALVRFRQVIVATNDRWNPARRQLYLGAAFALASMLLHALVVFVIYIKIIRDYQNA
jgi:hypothetical protein